MLHACDCFRLLVVAASWSVASMYAVGDAMRPPQASAAASRFREVQLQYFHDLHSLRRATAVPNSNNGSASTSEFNATTDRIYVLQNYWSALPRSTLTAHILKANMMREGMTFPYGICSSGSSIQKNQSLAAASPDLLEASNHARTCIVGGLGAAALSLALLIMTNARDQGGHGYAAPKRGHSSPPPVTRELADAVARSSDTTREPWLAEAIAEAEANLNSEDPLLAETPLKMPNSFSVRRTPRRDNDSPASKLPRIRPTSCTPADTTKSSPRRTGWTSSKRPLAFVPQHQLNRTPPDAKTLIRKLIRSPGHATSSSISPSVIGDGADSPPSKIPIRSPPPRLSEQPHKSSPCRTVTTVLAGSPVLDNIVPGYDRLTIKALQPIVKQLNPQELAVVRSYEVKHAGRVTLLKILNRLLLEAEEAAATLS